MIGGQPIRSSTTGAPRRCPSAAGLGRSKVAISSPDNFERRPRIESLVRSRQKIYPRPQKRSWSDMPKRSARSHGAFSAAAEWLKKGSRTLSAPPRHGGFNAARASSDLWQEIYSPAARQHRRDAAVNADVAAGDEAGVVGNKEVHGMGDIQRRSPPPRRR